MYALFKEINTFFSHNSGVIIILSYLITNGAFYGFSGDFNILDSGFTQMNGLFSLSPFLFLVFIPALTMRLFADEFKKELLKFFKLHLFLIQNLFCQVFFRLNPCFLSYIPQQFIILAY